MNKFTAIDPAGKAHTRTSKTRTYTHTVVALPSSLASTMAAMSPELRRLHRANFAYHAAYADGTSRFLQRQSWETEERHVERQNKEIAQAIAELNGCDTAGEYELMKVEAQLERIRHSMAQGYYDTYQNLGWCGRADLAAKLKATSEARSWVSVTILVAE